MPSADYKATVTTDEDGETAFVLIHNGQPDTPEKAIKALIETAERDGWFTTYDRTKLGIPRRRWYKWPAGDTSAEYMVQCKAVDRDRDSEWWVIPNLSNAEVDDAC